MDLHYLLEVGACLLRYLKEQQSQADAHVVLDFCISPSVTVCVCGAVSGG